MKTIQDMAAKAKGPLAVQSMRSYYEQLRLAGGYDHTYVLRPAGPVQSLVHAAGVTEPRSGRKRPCIDAW